MMRGFFNPDNFLWRFFDRIADIFILSILWFLCSLPIVTIGAASTALYDCVAHCLRNEEGSTYTRFFRTFKSELKITIPSTLLWGVLLFAGVFVVLYLRTVAQAYEKYQVFYIFYLVIMILPTGAACWIWPAFSRFTYTFKTLNITALKLAVAYLPRTVVMAVSLAVSALLSLQYVLPTFFLPALLVWGWTYLTEPVFDRLGGGLKKAEIIPDTPSAGEE